MPSSRSGPDPLDPGPAGFAHRGLHGPGVPENSLAAFAAALEAGAGIECDVRLSGDGRPMLFHDHDLRRLCASALCVETTPAELLQAQRLFDSNEHIPGLEELLLLVQGRVPILVEIKCHGGNVAQLTRAVTSLLEDYPGPLGVMSFEPDVGKWLRRNAPRVRRGLVLSRRASPVARWLAIRGSSPQFLAVDRAAVERSWVAVQRRARWVYSWTIATRGQRRTAEAHADAMIWEGDGRPRN
ncbi:MAG: glycerophosphodiester phosphodiesterase [Sphingomonas sp.]|nr:glycerophosphodiester phosphodiesterase [Sphingomonas sp.]